MAEGIHDVKQDTGTRAEPTAVEATTCNCTMRLGEDGIIRETVFPGSVETLEAAREAIACVEQISNGKRRPLFVDIRQVKAVERDARQLFASREASRTVCAVALLVASPVSRVIGNFMLGLNRIGVPTQLFTDEAKAVTWLGKHLDCLRD